jgi:ABC-type multidrug transport system fused ATPase/permease subunit
MTVVTVSNTDQALLIILSVFLAMFLLLSIIALIWILQILNELKKIIRRAEELARETESSINTFFQKTGPALSLVRLISNMSDAVFGGKPKKHKKEDD